MSGFDGSIGFGASFLGKSFRFESLFELLLFEKSKLSFGIKLGFAFDDDDIEIEFSALGNELYNKTLPKVAAVIDPNVVNNNTLFFFLLQNFISTPIVNKIAIHSNSNKCLFAYSLY